MGLYARYQDGIAADSGAVAAFKWFFISLLVHFFAIMPAIACMVAAVVLRRDSGPSGTLLALFILNVLAVRVFFFAMPCERAARAKGYGPRFLWGALGFFAFSFAVAVLALLPQRTPTAPPAS